ncbi:MAG: hypothetical protein IJU92_02400 [Spirochaetaceae bacterium]|nr:hypothetical protein [Spirochaetaceae bacterium]
MKQKIKVILLSTIVCLLFFVSCTGSYILAAVENEIKLKKATANGTIREILKIGDSLYLGSATVKTKKVFEQGAWTVLPAPEKTLVCTSIATDGTTLYATFMNVYEDTSSGVYYYDTTQSTWIKVSGSEEIQHVSGTGAVFGTKTVTTLTGGGTEVEHEEMTVYTVNTGGVAPIKTFQADGKEASHITAAGGDYFATEEGVFNSAVVRVDSLPDGEKIVAIDSTGTYFLSETKLYYGSDWSKSYLHGIRSPTSVTSIDIHGVSLLLVSSNDRYSGGYAEIVLDTADITKCVTKRPATFQESSTPEKCKDQYDSSIARYLCSVVFGEALTSGGYYVYVGLNDAHFANYTGLWGLYVDPAYPENTQWNRE